MPRAKRQIIITPGDESPVEMPVAEKTATEVTPLHTPVVVSIPPPPPLLGDEYIPRGEGLDFEAALRVYPGYRVTRVAEHNLDKADTDDPNNRKRVRKGFGYILNEDICTDDGHGNLKFRGMWLYVETEVHYEARKRARALRYIRKMQQIVEGVQQHHRVGEIEVTDARANLTQHNTSMGIRLDPASMAVPSVPTTPAASPAPGMVQFPSGQQIAESDLLAAMQKLYGHVVPGGPYPVEADDGSEEPDAVSPAGVAGPVLGQGVNATQSGSEGGE